jgi:putative nucleotidyltransferase with HDIG domain
MKKLLFALADPQICDGLRVALLERQAEWQGEVILLAEISRDTLAKNTWDALVADLEVDGGRALLVQSRREFPEIARIGVVRHARRDVTQLALAQQIIRSFVDLSELDIAVQRCCALRDLLRGERICRTIGELGELPSAPGVYLELMTRLDGPDASVAEVAAVIEKDAGISAKVLQIVNSPVFRTSRDVVTVKMAAGLLGLNVVKNVLLSVEAFQSFEHLQRVPDFSFSALQSHCCLTAAIAGRMGLSNEVRDTAVVAALLHDVGKLVLASKAQDRFGRILARAKAEGRPLYRVEEELWGITHAEVGAYLMGLWGLPTQVTEAIAYHHSPSTVPPRPLDALGCVYVANGLAHEVEKGIEWDWDKNYLKAWGGLNRLDEWRVDAKEALNTQTASANQNATHNPRHRVSVH